MNIKIYPRKLAGSVQAIPSKSYAHRMLICAAFSDSPTHLQCSQTNDDIEATAGCLCALGASITRTNTGYVVIPCRELPKTAVLDCKESGTTLRLMLPICCALGVEATFCMAGRLPYRPVSPLWEELERMGCTLTRPTTDTIHTEGKLKAGTFSIRGDVSSQYISGLLFASALLEGKSRIEIIGKIESWPYIQMTQQVLHTFGVMTEKFEINGHNPFHAPSLLKVEGDWSNAAFFLTAHALGSDVSVIGLNEKSVQGDRAILEILRSITSCPVISAANIPDLVPVLAVYFACKSGAVFTDIQRLRLKESDRVDSVCRMICALGANAEADENQLTIYPGEFHEAVVDSASDHRIAMAAAVAATQASGPITVLGAECVAKSYPAFWQEYAKMGGHYEQLLR